MPAMKRLIEKIKSAMDNILENTDQTLSNTNKSLYFYSDCYLLSIEEVSRLLRIHRTKVKELIELGKLPFIKRNNSIHIPQFALKDFLKSQLVKYRSKE